MPIGLGRATSFSKSESPRPKASKSGNCRRDASLSPTKILIGIAVICASPLALVMLLCMMSLVGVAGVFVTQNGGFILVAVFVTFVIYAWKKGGIDR